MSDTEFHLPKVVTPNKSKSKHSFRESFLPSTQPSRLEKFQSQQDVRLNEMSLEPPRRYNRQYFRIPTQNIEKGPNTDKDIIAQLQNNSEDPYEDQKPKELVGDNAIKSYYSSYKKINRIKEQNKYFNIPNSVQTNLITKAEKLTLLPCKMGIVKPKGERNVLHLQNQKFGDQYVQVLSEGLKGLPIIQDFNLNQNRIKESGASLILPLITKQARVIELLSNSIGQKGLEPVIGVLPTQNCRIQILNLEDNQLGDQLIIELCKAMSQNNSVEKLNISKNLIKQQSCSALKSMLEMNDSILELYLHWNSIKGSDAIDIFKILTTNKNLKVLDFSYNLLGCGQTGIGSVLKEFFIENKALLHLDLSGNAFNFQDCSQIAEGLAKNHSIYGFHFGGNYGYVDSKGFLILDNNMRNFNKIHVEQRIKGVNQNCKPYECSARSEKVKDACWICDGWRAATFSWVPEKSGSASEEPIFIHYDYEGFEPIFLGKAQKDGSFSTHRMIPQGEITYFYTANSMQLASACDPIKVHNEKFKTRVKLDDQIVDVVIDETNYYTHSDEKEVIIDWEPTFDVLPRTPDPVYIPARRKKAKRIWSFPISIWAPKYKFETEEVLRKCFEKDWNCCKIPKFVKKQEELDQIKELLWKAYKPIKESYKHYASFNPNGDVFSMSQNPTSEFVNACQIIDGTRMKLADVDLKFIATWSASTIDYKGNFRNPERTLVRYQLMEFLVRIAEDKFVRNSQQPVTMVQATTMMLDLCLPHMKTFDAHKWRMERYFIEQCDDVCKKYKQIFDYVYIRNSSKKVKPGQPPFMCLDELKDICNKAQLYDENFVDRDVNIAFNLAMMTQVDELDSNRIFEMQQIEFMEAIARIAEKYSPSKIGKNYDTYEQRFNQPLYYKLEAFMIHLINTQVDDETKKNLKIPTISMFDVEEEDEYY